MKYKVGDIVKLRDDLEFGKYYGGMQLSETFHGGIIGKKGKIKRCASYGYWTMFKGGRVWCDITDEMIEGLWEECKSSEQVSKSESKYKLIDILNKIANGELKEGTKVKWGEEIYTYHGDDELYRTKGTSDFDLWDEMYLGSLNEEVELIEPKHLPDVGEMIEPTDNTKIEELVVDETDINCLGIHSKTILLNIIDRLNKVINKVNIHSTVLLAQEKDIKEIQEELDY